MPTSREASEVSSRVDAWPFFSFRTRKMFSTMMMEPLAIFPMPIARSSNRHHGKRYPKDIHQDQRDENRYGNRQRGDQSAVLKSHMKKIMTTMMSTAPWRMEIWTCSRDLRIKMDWS